MGLQSNKAIDQRTGTPRSEVAAVGARLIGFVALFVVFFPLPAMAQESEERAPRWNSESCLSCHDDSEETLTFPSGEEISIGVDGDGYLATPHAKIGVQCVHCHTSIVRVPHDPITVSDAASFSASLSTSCSKCHWRQYTIALDQLHALIPSESRNEAPTCIDCHDPHTAQGVAIEDPTMQAACDECHSSSLEDEVAAVHVFNPIATEKADPPPLILFYGLILGAVLVFVGVVWAAVAIIQRAGRRGMSSPA